MTEEALKTLAANKANGSTALVRIWEIALMRLASTGIAACDFEKIAQASNNPGAISRLAAQLSGAPGACANFLLACDASTHGLGEWIEALDVLGAWLDKKGRAEPFLKCVGYVSCSSQGSPETNLPWCVSQMLDQYGMDK